MAEVIKNAPTGNVYIDSLLTPNRWANTDLTFSFPTQASHYGANYSSAGEPYKGFEPLNNQQKTAIRNILESIEDFTKLDFTEMTETNTNHAVLRFAETKAIYSPSVTSAWTYHPATRERAGDGWYNDSPPNGMYNTPEFGNRPYNTMIHEVGHQIGLKHPHDARGVVMPDDHDSRDWTVMSYNRISGGNLQTYGPDDIRALQHLYGANFDHNSGNTTYRWNSSTGEMSVNGAGQGRPAVNKVFMSVWDGGGTDTYDLSNYTTTLRIDLNPGAWSTISGTQYVTGAEGSIANPHLYNGDIRSLIENAKGGSAADQITGNQLGNKLEGNGGNDTLRGGAGNDTLIGGAGADTLYGGSGSDTFVFGKESSVDTVKDWDAGDRYDIRAWGLSAGELTITHDAGRQQYVARGDNADEQIRFDQRPEVSQFIIGSQAQTPSDPGDTPAEPEPEPTEPETPDEPEPTDPEPPANPAPTDPEPPANPVPTKSGTSRNDRIAGTSDRDVIDGGSGNDRLWGRDGDDVLIGGSGNDRLYGNAGNDVLEGGSGNDRLYGGSGNDILNSGSGRDIFVFDTPLDAATNVDTILNFNSTQDRIHLNDRIFAETWDDGRLRPSWFRAGDEAVDRNDHIIYDQGTGTLSYDADGSGSDPAVHFATIDNKPALTASDFWII